MRSSLLKRRYVQLLQFGCGIYKELKVALPHLSADLMAIHKQERWCLKGGFRVD